LTANNQHQTKPKQIKVKYKILEQTFLEPLTIKYHTPEQILENKKQPNHTLGPFFTGTDNKNIYLRLHINTINMTHNRQTHAYQDDPVDFKKRWYFKIKHLSLNAIKL
jgi:hypothetical protein